MTWEHMPVFKEAIRHQVTEALRWQVFDGGDFPTSMEGRGDVGGGIRYDQIQTGSDFSTSEGKLSASTHVDMDIHLVHNENDDPAAVLARKATLDDIVRNVEHKVSQELRAYLDADLVEVIE